MRLSDSHKLGESSYSMGGKNAFKRQFGNPGSCKLFTSGLGAKRTRQGSKPASTPTNFRAVVRRRFCLSRGRKGRTNAIGGTRRGFFKRPIARSLSPL